MVAARAPSCQARPPAASPGHGERSLGPGARGLCASVLLAEPRGSVWAEQWEGEVWSGCEDRAEVGMEVTAEGSERFGAIGRRVALGTEIQDKGK